MDAIVRQMEERDLDEVDRILRVAFGTFNGLPDPIRMFGDTDKARTRWRARPDAALVAEIDGRLVGSNFVADWGSVGFFGPLSVSTELWNRKIGQRLLDPTMEMFGRWKTRHVGLFTFSQSAKHVALYQKYGFWPRFLTAVMAKPVTAVRDAKFATFSAASADEKTAIIAECRSLADSIYGGLDLTREINSVEQQRLGDTIVVHEGSRVAGFAVCHIGPRTEAGSDTCFVKFGAADSNRTFDRLLEACEAFAISRGVSQIIAGANVARIEAYRAMIGRGFRTTIQGVAMQQDNDPGYNREGVFIIDDWR